MKINLLNSPENGLNFCHLIGAKDKTIKDVKSNDKDNKNDDIVGEIVDKKNVLLESLKENIEVRGENPDVVDDSKEIRNAFEVMMVRNRGDLRSNSPNVKRLKRLKNNQKNDEGKKGSLLKWLKKE